MKLRTVTVELFRNVVDAQRVEIEPDVTCLVGKNESGKTAILRALHRLKPANGVAADNKFNLTIDYPRWRLSRDRKRTPEIQSQVTPIRATYELDDDDIGAMGEAMPVAPPQGTVCEAWRRYDNIAGVRLSNDLRAVIEIAATESAVDPADADPLLASASLSAAQETARATAKEIKEEHPLRSKALASFASGLEKYSFLTGAELTKEQVDLVWARVPASFYFSSYDLLPGECDLTALTEKLAGGGDVDRHEQTVVSLLHHAGEDPKDFLDEDYASRKAELQAASSDLTQHVFQYWRQNTDLEVVFGDDNVSVRQLPSGTDVMHRILKIEIRDARHGGVETNFATRSAGFQWFFSFFAAFSEYQESARSMIVLLDEPGTSLHGEAQQDFVRYVFSELGASKQTLYTTHSQHMVDPTKYEKLRAVHDRATKETPDQGVVVTRVDLSADRSTILPVESALGYSVSQHLFLGSGHHLAVEGSSDFVYLLRMSEHMMVAHGMSLDPHFAVIPVGGVDNMPAFVALMGRRLKVTALIDGQASGRKAARVKAAATNNGLPEESVVICGELSQDLPAAADIEDLFDTEDYLRLYNWAFGTQVTQSELPATSEPILRRLEAVVGSFDHALPAHALTDHRAEFFASVSPETIRRFGSLFDRINGTLALEFQ